MADFWNNYNDITNKKIILYVILVIQYYINTQYNKNSCQISYLSEEQTICQKSHLIESSLSHLRNLLNTFIYFL